MWNILFYDWSVHALRSRYLLICALSLIWMKGLLSVGSLQMLQGCTPSDQPPFAFIALCFDVLSAW